MSGFLQIIFPLTSSFSLPIFTANETITNLTQYQLSQEKSDLLISGLYFSMQSDKIWKSKIFNNFEKIHRLFISNLKSDHGVIILNRSNNSVFLYLKIYWNRQVFDLIRASGIWMKPKLFVTRLLPQNFKFCF